MDNERKTGILRLAELFGRDFKAFFGAGFLALLGCGPFLLGFRSEERRGGKECL